MSDKVTYSNSVLKITNEHGFAWGGSVTEETAREIVRVLQSQLTPVPADLGVERCPRCDSVLQGGYCAGCGISYAPSR